MDSRPLLNEVRKVRVFIDSKTFEDLLNNHDRLAIAILKYYDSERLDFVRSPFKTKFDEMKKVVEYKLKLDGSSKINSIEIIKEDSQEVMAFSYKMEDIISIAKKIYEKKKIQKNELEKIIYVFIQAVFNRFEKSNIYVTNEKILLKNRLWFESHFPGYPLNIMSVKEASIFLDLLFKKNEEYCVSSRYTLNKGYWYWLSMRLKLPHYNVGDKMLDALAYRFYYALMALDEIGIQYYTGVNNDTMDNMFYHFNYLISLITGIFDNLALKTNTALGINFRPGPKVSLSNKNGRDFLREIRSKDQTLRNHIHSYVEFINLIYLFRELVIHREGLSKTGFENIDTNGKWKANFIKITKEIKEKIDLCGDKKDVYNPFTKWGVYRIHTEFLLEPYHFSIQSLITLKKFVDEYLRLLGCPSFIETQKRKQCDFTRTLTLFEKYHLGF